MTRLTAPGAMLALLLAACGADTPEARLEAQAEDVADAEARIADVREEIGDTENELEVRRAAVAEAQKALADARSDLRRLQKKLAAEREALDTTATDTAIFRLLQKRLLEDELLADAAINIFVLDGTVVMYGDVDADDRKARAGDLAANTPGVENVRNFIDVNATADRTS